MRAEIRLGHAASGLSPDGTEGRRSVSPNQLMEKRFHFADAFWFRVPLKALVLAVAVFAFLSLYPGLLNGTRQDHERALFGLTVLGGFMVSATVFIVAINDSHVGIDDDAIHIHFEAFFVATIPIADIVGVREIDPRPHWRYRFGLSTNFDDRIACSHGGRFVEIVLAGPQLTRLWPRRLPVTRFWIAVREHDEFINQLRAIAPSAVGGDSAAAA